MSFEDHFNYPNPTRNDTMYLSTLKGNEHFTRKTFYKDRSPNLDITDIERAQPKYQGIKNRNAESFCNRNDDIAGSFPKKLHQPLSKIYYNLKNDDIHGTKPQSHKFVTTREPSNPLNPMYKLPHTEVRVATPPKFVRDHIDIKDIDGARPNPYTKWNIDRKTNLVDDIDGARPKKEWVPQGKQSSLDVKDINSFYEFHTNRHTDPLSPRYKVTNQENELINYGQLDNKPMVRHPKDVNKVTSLDLKTSDINGAQASTATQHITKLATRNEFMKVHDVPGAQTGTLKKGMSTARHLDPLWPTYRVPGRSEPAPLYGKNLNSSAVTKYGAKTMSDFGVTQSAADQAYRAMESSQVSQANEPRVPLVERQNSGSQNVERKASGQKTPLVSEGSQGGARKVSSPLARTGAEVLGGNTEYVPARITSVEEKAPIKSISKPKSGMNFETKKALNSNEGYQQNVKSFWGMNGDENKGFKSFTASEKLDKFISK